MRGLTITALGMLATIGTSCRGRESFPDPPPGLLTSAQEVQAGERVYDRNCAICHGPAAHGDGPQAASLDPRPSDLRSLSGVRSDVGYWFERIKEGGKAGPLPRPGSAMPSWGEHLTDEEIWEVVAYLKSLVEEQT
jgi:mono/diheme cytochrome c family protein